MTEYSILNLKGVRQSFGLQTTYSNRTSAAFVTKSALLGIISNAAGIKYPFIDLEKSNYLRNTLSENLNFVVYKDIENNVNSCINRDFQTIRRAKNVKGKLKKNAIITNREYLMNADFIISISVDENSSFNIKDISNFLYSPKSIIFLGRKCCIPSTPIFRTIIEASSLEESLKMFLQKEKLNGITYSSTKLSECDYVENVRDDPFFYGEKIIYYNREVFIKNF